ncbi:MAG: glycoside hydrolase family 5 protein [Chitinispirillaceae bacterium]|nr:glycoside hydrolase family 5 protein [Chitinispirillaceae bacterium]
MLIPCRRTIMHCAVFFVIIALLPISQPLVFAINTPWLHVDGAWLKDPDGNKVVLRGIAVLPPKDQKSGKGFDFIAEKATEPNMYTRVIRIPVMPEAWNSSYLTQYLKPCVDVYTKKGVYVIIDWHYIKDYEALDQSTRDFWTTVAPAFKDYSNVLYEVFNEPIYPAGQSAWATWKSTAQPWVDLIRTAAPKNIIIIGSPRWTQEAKFAVNSPFKGENLVYAIHVYPVHQGWDDMFGKPCEKIPIFLSEWGYQNAGSFGSEVKGTTLVYGESMKAYLDAHPNVNWTAWIFDANWYPVMVDQNYALRGGEDYQGAFVQTFLKEKKDDDLPGGSTGALPELLRIDRQSINQPISIHHMVPDLFSKQSSASGLSIRWQGRGSFDVTGRLKQPGVPSVKHNAAQ